MLKQISRTFIGLTTAVMLLVSPFTTIAASNGLVQDNSVTFLAAPSNPTRTGQWSHLNITIGWKDNSDNETGFEIQRAVGIDSADFHTIVITDPDVTTYMDTNVTPDTHYNYRIRAVNATDSSAWSATVSTRTYYNPPSGLIATPKSSNQIQLSWTDTNNNKSGTGIYRKNLASAEWVWIFASEKTITSYTDQNLTPGTTYIYAVDAGCYTTDPQGCFNPWSLKSDSAVATTLLLTPTDFTTSLSTAHLISLKWTDNNSSETGYEIQRADHPLTPTSIWQTITVTGPEVAAYTDNTVAPCKIYWYHIRAVGSDSSSDYSYSTGTTTKMNPPVNLQARPLSPTQIVLTWEEGTPCANGYNIYRKSDLAAQWMSLDSTGKTTTYIGGRLEPGKTYYYEINAVCFNLALNNYCQSNSDFSNTAVVNTPPFAVFLPVVIQ